MVLRLTSFVAVCLFSLAMGSFEAKAQVVSDDPLVLCTGCSSGWQPVSNSNTITSKKWKEYIFPIGSVDQAAKDAAAKDIESQLASPSGGTIKLCDQSKCGANEDCILAGIEGPGQWENPKPVSDVNKFCGTRQKDPNGNYYVECYYLVSFNTGNTGRNVIRGVCDCRA